MGRNSLLKGLDAFGKVSERERAKERASARACLEDSPESDDWIRYLMPADNGRRQGQDWLRRHMYATLLLLS